MLSSAAVRSRAVPNVVMVLTKRRSPPGAREDERHRHDVVVRRLETAGQVEQLLEQGRDHGRSGDGGLTAEAGQDVPAPGSEVADARRQPVRVQAEPQDVDRRLQQVRRQAGQQCGHPAVRLQQVPAAVDDERWVRLERREHALDAFADRAHVGVVERPFPERRSEARGHQQLVLLAWWHLERLGQLEHHRAARLRTSGLDVAEVARGHVRLVRQVELADASAASPVAQQGADRCGRRSDGLGEGGHGSTLLDGVPQDHDLGGHCGTHLGRMTLAGMDTTTSTTTTHTSVLTLRNVLLLDAVLTGVNGLAYVAGATVPRHAARTVDGRHRRTRRLHARLRRRCRLARHQTPGQPARRGPDR